MTATQFAAATTITATGPSTYAADLDPLWTVLGNPNGGYLQAIMARVAAAHSVHPHVVAASTHYLRAPHTGPAELDIEVLREGRTMTQSRVRLSQAGEAKAETLFNLSDLSDISTEPQWKSADVPAPAIPFDQCDRYLPPREIFPVEVLRQMHLHPEPASLPFTRGEPRGIGEIRGWLNLPDKEGFDPSSLLLAADVLPPATMDVKLTGWVPTLELSTFVRALPAPGPVHVLLKANLIQGDRVDESCTIRDSRGVIVAQSHQLANIRFE